MLYMLHTCICFIYVKYLIYVSWRECQVPNIEIQNAIGEDRLFSLRKLKEKLQNGGFKTERMYDHDKDLFYVSLKW